MRLITILHIEDDPNLADVVKLAFERFGFQGEFLHASTVIEGLDRIRLQKSRNERLDLIIADMNLPDGRGLEIVRQVKLNPAWASIPVLLLSSDTKNSVVEEAYALGVNCYLPKNGASFLKTLESAYHFWLKDSVIPHPGKNDPVHEFLGCAISYKARVSELYSRLAQHFSGDSDRHRFWLSLALFQSNQANLLAFVNQSLRKPSVPEEILECLERYGDAKRPGYHSVLKLAEANSGPSFDESLKWALAIESEFDPENFSKAVSAFFPNEPVAFHAFKESIICYLQELAKRAMLESKDAKVRKVAEKLLNQAAVVDKMIETPQGVSGVPNS
jgi:two-component system, chemotaxis family, chemotaxis protein CheY